MKLRVRLPSGVLDNIEAFLTDRGSFGAEGTGLVACRVATDKDGWWEASRFIIPDQRAQVGPFGCSVEVTESGKTQLAAALGPDELYLVRVHSHPVEAFHSPTDDTNPALTHSGALSVVVPYFGLGLRRGVGACAVFRLEEQRWVELPQGPVRDRWLVVGGE